MSVLQTRDSVLDTHANAASPCALDTWPLHDSCNRSTRTHTIMETEPAAGRLEPVRVVVAMSRGVSPTPSRRPPSSWFRFWCACARTPNPHAPPRKQPHCLAWRNSHRVRDKRTLRSFCVCLHWCRTTASNSACPCSVVGGSTRSAGQERRRRVNVTRGVRGVCGTAAHGWRGGGTAAQVWRVARWMAAHSCSRCCRTSSQVFGKTILGSTILPCSK